MSAGQGLRKLLILFVLFCSVMEALPIGMNGDLGQVERVSSPDWLSIYRHLAMESR